MLFQFSRPVLTAEHQARITAAIAGLGAAVAFYPPFGVFVNARGRGTVPPDMVEPVQQVLAAVAAAWDVVDVGQKQTNGDMARNRLDKRHLISDIRHFTLDNWHSSYDKRLCWSDI